MGPELAIFRAIIELFWPTLAKMAILNTVESIFISFFGLHTLAGIHAKLLFS